MRVFQKKASIDFQPFKNDRLKIIAFTIIHLTRLFGTVLSFKVLVYINEKIP
jgi:hypothetical protein